MCTLDGTHALCDRIYTLWHMNSVFDIMYCMYMYVTSFLTLHVIHVLYLIRFLTLEVNQEIIGSEVSLSSL